MNQLKNKNMEKRRKHHKNPKNVNLIKVFKMMERELIFLRKISKINLKKLHIPFTTN